jgi:2-methylcitrate dehydratase
LAAFNIGAWFVAGFSSTPGLQRVGHPSDNLGAWLAVADFVCRKKPLRITKAPFRVRDLLTAMIKAHEIQGISRSGKQYQTAAGLDHVLWSAFASTGFATALVGGTRAQLTIAISKRED